MTFYNSFVLNIEKTPVIVYPTKGLEKVISRHKPNAIEEHLKALYEANPDLKNGEYHIDVLWNKGNDIITDIWVFSESETWMYGPLGQANIYRNLTLTNDIPTTTGDRLVMLGSEEETRNSRIGTNGLFSYLMGQRALLPEYLLVKQNFEQK